MTPSAHDINPFDCLDGREAEKHFLGRSLDDAYLLFDENFLYYQEDLMFMGPVAFCYYLPAAIRYAESPGAAYESDVADTLLMVLKHRWRYEASEIRSSREAILEYCKGVLNRIAQMDPEYWNYHGDLESKFRDFVSDLQVPDDASEQGDNEGNRGSE